MKFKKICIFIVIRLIDTFLLAIGWYFPCFDRVVVTNAIDTCASKARQQIQYVCLLLRNSSRQNMFVLEAAIFLSGIYASQAAACPVGWHRYGETCYLPINNEGDLAGRESSMHRQASSAGLASVSNGARCRLGNVP